MAGKIAQLNTPRPHSVFPGVLSICQTRISKLLQFRSLVGLNQPQLTPDMQCKITEIVTHEGKAAKKKNKSHAVATKPRDAACFFAYSR